VKRIIALAAAGAAVAGLAACSHAAAPAAATAPASHPAASPAVPVSCRQGRGVMAALHAVSTAGAAGDPQTLTAALKDARPAVARAARHPIPACADPRGYWPVLLMHVNAAAATKGPASSTRAAMTGVPKIEHELTTELQHTAQ